MKEYNPKENKIVVKCRAADTLPIDRILEFQGDLKTLSKVNRTKLFNSICQEGFIAPMFLWDDQGEWRLLDGHGRLKTLLWMREQGWDIPMLPVDYIDAIDEADARRKLLKITSQYGEFNTEELDAWIKEAGEEIEDSIRLVDTEIEIIVEGDQEETVGDDEVPDVPEEPDTVLGDLWELGDHRLLCGDSTKHLDLEKLCVSDMADLMVTDPPYNVDYEGKTADSLKIENDKMGDGAFREFLIDAFVAANGQMKPGASFYIWFADVETYNFTGAVKDSGFKLSQMIIWKKNSLVMGRKDYHFIHEPCLYGWKEGSAHLWASDRKQTTVIEMNRPSRSDIHPTMKPVELFKYCIENNTKGGDLILDPFLGSGTSIIASEQTGRRCYGLELDPHYCDVIRDRYIQWCDTNGKSPIIKLNGEVWNGKE